MGYKKYMNHIKKEYELYKNLSDTVVYDDKTKVSADNAFDKNLLDAIKHIYRYQATLATLLKNEDKTLSKDEERRLGTQWMEQSMEYPGNTFVLSQKSKEELFENEPAKNMKTDTWKELYKLYMLSEMNAIKNDAILQNDKYETLTAKVTRHKEMVRDVQKKKQTFMDKYITVNHKDVPSEIKRLEEKIAAEEKRQKELTEAGKSVDPRAVRMLNADKNYLKHVESAQMDADELNQNIKKTEKSTTQMFSKETRIVKGNLENKIRLQAKKLLDKGEVHKGLHINTSEFKRMETALKLVSQWGTPEADKLMQKNKLQFKSINEALDHVAKTSRDYLDAKSAQTRSNPSQMRLVRIAVAEAAVNFAEICKDTIEINKQIDDKKVEKLNEYQNKCINLISGRERNKVVDNLINDKSVVEKEEVDSFEL